MTDDDNRRHWRLVWLSSLQAFGDSDVQETRWLDKRELNPHFSFVECMCCYFDDAFLAQDNAYEKKRAAGYVSEAEVAAVADFHALADRYKSPDGEDWNAHRILNDPKWQDVVHAAQVAQTKLLSLIADDAERAALSGPLAWRADGGAFKADLIGSTITLGLPSEGRPARHKPFEILSKWFGKFFGRQA